MLRKLTSSYALSQTEKERLANGYLWPGKLLGVIGEVTGSLVMWFFWENPWW